MKVEAVICREIWLLYTGQHGVISELILIFSSFDGNKLQYYQNILWLIILKGTFSPSNLRALMCVNIISPNVTYLHQYLASECVPETSSTFPSPFTTNISHPFHISFKPPFATYFSHHILSNVFDQSFHIAAQFQNRQLCVL